MLVEMLRVYIEMHAAAAANPKRMDELLAYLRRNNEQTEGKNE